MIKLAASTLCITAALLPTLIGPHTPQSTGVPRDGLALELSWTGELGSSDASALKMAVVNVSNTDQVLEADLYYEGGEGEPGDQVAAWLAEVTNFHTIPEVLAAPFQTGGVERKSPQPTHRLAPGERLSVQWNVKDGYLQASGTYSFPRLGTYRLRASVVVNRSGADPVRLFSNEVNLVRGNTVEAPGACTAEIRSIDRKAPRARLGVGAADGVSTGEVFQIIVGMHESWELTITHVHPTWSAANMVPKNTRGEQSGNNPTWPRLGSKANLKPN